jgi:hypothetical protein
MMVEGLSKHITGDWMEIGQASLSLAGLAEYFGFSDASLSSIASQLSRSVEHGVIEYKESILNPCFHFLEDMKFKSVSFEKLADQKEEIAKLLFVTLVQRLFATGGMISQSDLTSPLADTEKDVKLILADILARVRDNQTLKNNTSVKMILTQLAIYQRERETMEKLKPNIKDTQKAASFQKNFSNTFNKISENIRKYYAEYLNEEQHLAKNENRATLDRFPLREFLSLFTKQAREFLRLYSTITFVLKGKYKVREICVHLFNEKAEFFKLLDGEREAYRKTAQPVLKEPAAQSEHVISMAFIREIAAVAEKLVTAKKSEDAAVDEEK